MAGVGFLYFVGIISPGNVAMTLCTCMKAVQEEPELLAHLFMM